MEQMKFVRLRLVGYSSFSTPMENLEELISFIREELKNGDVSDKWELEIIEMTAEEYKSLPEFAGF